MPQSYLLLLKWEERVTKAYLYWIAHDYMNIPNFTL